MSKGGREPVHAAQAAIQLAFAPGHFYSPIVDVAALAAQRDRLWPANPTVAGIDLNDESHYRLLTGAFPRYLPEYDYPEHLDEEKWPGAFYTRNSQFSWLDPRALFVLLRTWRPQRVIEVGAGYSSLLIADVNRRFVARSIDFTCIDPYPRAFLNGEVVGISRLIAREVQQVPLDEFRRLRAGDILFIDSSHVAKTGSDVNFLYFDVLPALHAGVHVHVHDIFLPFDYPPDWVLTNNRSWNEQYVLRALLMYAAPALRVDFGCMYAFHRFPELVIAAIAHPKRLGFAGGSFWFTKLA